MRLYVLSHVHITRGDGEPVSIPQRKVRQLVCTLALLKEPVSSEELRDLLWEESSGRDLRSALTTTVAKARHMLPPDVLVHGDTGYRLDLTSAYLDADEFASLARQAKAVREADPGRAADLYQSALALWGGQKLPDLPETPAARAVADGLLIDRRDAIEALAEARLALGNHAAVVRDLRTALKDDPTNEHLWAPYLLALYRDGRKAEALDAYEQALSTFLTEVGADPGPLLQGLRARIAGNDPALMWEPDRPVREARAIAAGVDITKPSPARIYDCLLGGVDHFEADRVAAQKLLEALPTAAELAADNRAFMVRVVEELSRRGVKRFLDLGTGIPTSPNVHEVARAAQPDTRVVYVDNDPWVNAHNRAWRAGVDGVACVNADIRDPETVFVDRNVRALAAGGPVAVLIIAVLQWVENAEQVVTAFRDWMPPGSYLALAVGTGDGLDDDERDRVKAVYRRGPSELIMRTPKQVEALFGGLDLLEPGIVEPVQWRNSDKRSFTASRSLAGVARKA